MKRDPREQNEYRARVEEESQKLYNKTICYLLKREYKGLVASHIKPYKICELENDEIGKFDVNNALLLSKGVDDYFDKLLMTFDKDGTPIFSDEVSVSVREEYQQYKLDDIVLNEERQAYLKVHRALFYYKNNYKQSSEVKIIFESKIYKELKYLNDRQLWLILNDNLWSVAKINQIKNLLAIRELKLYKSLSFAKLINIMSSREEFILTDRSIYEGINFNNGLFDGKTLTDKGNQKVYAKINLDYNHKLTSSDNRFIDNLFSNYTVSSIFQKIIGSALFNEKHKFIVSINGDGVNVDKLILKFVEVLDKYIYLTNSLQKFKKIENFNEIPDCKFLVFTCDPKNVVDDIVVNIIEDKEQSVNQFMDENRLIIMKNCRSNQKYSYPIVNIELNSNFAEFDNNISKLSDEFVIQWIIAGYNEFLESGLDENITNSITNTSNCSGLIKDWILEYCELGPYEESATLLYESYNKYCSVNNIRFISQVIFGKSLHYYATKKRASQGIVYVGIRIKK